MTKKQKVISIIAFVLIIVLIALICVSLQNRKNADNNDPIASKSPVERRRTPVWISCRNGI